MNVTTFLLLDDASSFSFRFLLWLPMVYCLSTASFRCTLYRPQLRTNLFKTSHPFAQSSISVIALAFSGRTLIGPSVHVIVNTPSAYDAAFGFLRMPNEATIPDF